MQHLDDALIAEWVDGGIPEGSREHDAIATHVEQCDECRLRVDEERALASHVRQLLGVAAPPERIPAFEEVLHRAGTQAAPPSPGGWRWRRLAWAATVVVAGGVGWYAHGALDGGAGFAADVGPARESRAPTAAATPTEAAAPALSGQAEAEGLGQARAEVPAAGPEGHDEATQAVVPAAPVADEARAARRQANEAESGVSAEAGAAARGAGRRDAAAPPAVVGAVTAAPMLEAPGTPAPTQKATAVEEWTPVSRAVAERVLGAPLRVVPGLAIQGIAVAPDGATVRVLQDLGGGAVLELVERLGATGQPHLAEAAERDRLGLAVAQTRSVVGGVEVLGRASVSRDSLAILLARLQ